MGLIGQFSGGFLAMIFLGAIIERLIVRRLMDEPAKGSLVSIVIAYAIAIVLYGFGSADGGAWRADGIILYLPGAVIAGTVMFISRRRPEE